MTNRHPTKLYKIPSEGKVMGVCAGIADYFDINKCAVRWMTIILMIFTGIWVVLIGYFVLGFILDPKPEDLYESEEEEKFWKQARRSPDYTAADIRRRFRDIERRTAEMETYMTSKQFKLERELKALED